MRLIVAATKMKIEKGFTLIEITIALLILAIGLVGVLTLFPVGFDAAGQANYLTVATFLAQGELEDAKVAGFDAVANETKASYVPPSPYTNFQHELVVTPIAGLDLKQVDVTIYWPETGEQQSIKLTTYIAKL